EISHLIRIRNDPDTNLVYAYIELFNIVCAVVILSENYDQENIDHSYYQDALTGKQIDENVSLHLSLKEIIQDKTDSEDFGILINSLIDRRTERDFNMIFQATILEIRDQVQREVEEQKIKKDEFVLEYQKRSCLALAELTVHQF